MNGLDPNEATETLKSLLKVGQPLLPSSVLDVGGAGEKPSSVNLLQQLFATAANVGSLSGMEQLVELRASPEGEAIPLVGQKDIRVDARVDKAEYLNNKVKIRNIVDLGWENK